VRYRPLAPSLIGGPISPILGSTMKKTIVLAAALLLPGLASAQFSASAGIRIDLPVVLPQLVVVSPGVQVVPDCDQEVFFVDGVYWARHDNGWYRSRSHRGGWALVGPRYVPARLAGMPRGKYKRWHPGPARHVDGGRGPDRGGDRGGHDRGGHDGGGKGHGKHKH
jgi:hypothetical protein